MIKPIHPGGGAFIKEVYLSPFNIGSNQLARELRLSKRIISRLLNSDARVTPELSLRLSSVLGRSTESWLRMQNNFDLSGAMDNFKAAEFQQIQFQLAK